MQWLGGISPGVPWVLPGSDNVTLPGSTFGEEATPTREGHLYRVGLHRGEIPHWCKTGRIRIALQLPRQPLFQSLPHTLTSHLTRV